ncbi:MAG: hypothetical protein RR178_05195 [Gordonibacter sp.]
MKRMKTQGLEAMPRISLGLTHSRAKALAFVREHGIEDANLRRGDAQTVALINGKDVRIMVLMECKGATRTQEHALLAHEAVHVAQHYFESLGEGEPSSEFAAYVVQATAQYLIERHEKWKRKRK